MKRLTTTAYGAVLGIFCAIAFAMPAVTFGYFTGTAVGDGNTFQAGTLAISVDDDTHELSIDETNDDDLSFTVSDDGTITPQYRLVAAPVLCSASFYNGLDVEVSHGGLLYAGGIGSMIATTSTPGTWDITISAGSMVAAENEECVIELKMQAWQTEFPLWNSVGFSDEEVITVTITADDAIGPQPTGNLVLNEIYPNPNNASTTPLDIEWVEIYNGTGSTIDIEGWDLSEMSGVNENKILISSANTCAPGSQQGFARPYNGASTQIPAGGLLLIEFCENNVLNNNGGETVRLYDAADSPVDAHTFGNTDKGKSHARIPDGATWVDPIPSPGESNMSTITREDLENELWSEEKIDMVLGRPEDVPKDDAEAPGGAEGGDDPDDLDEKTEEGTADGDDVSVEVVADVINKETEEVTDEGAEDEDNNELETEQIVEEVEEQKEKPEPEKEIEQTVKEETEPVTEPTV